MFLLSFIPFCVVCDLLWFILYFVLVRFVFSVLVLENLKPNQSFGRQSLKSVITRLNSAVVLRALVQLKRPF